MLKFYFYFYSSSSIQNFNAGRGVKNLTVYGCANLWVLPPSIAPLWRHFWGQYSKNLGFLFPHRVLPWRGNTRNCNVLFSSNNAPGGAILDENKHSKFFEYSPQKWRHKGAILGGQYSKISTPTVSVWYFCCCPVNFSFFISTSNASNVFTEDSSYCNLFCMYMSYILNFLNFSS